MTEPIFLPSEIRADFARAIGDAEVIVLHSAPRKIGYVAGGIDAILGALLDALGPRTLIVPTFTTVRVDPSTWQRPPAPPERWDAIRAELPLFDPTRSTPRAMGSLADLIWRLPGARRTAHPVESVAAIGPRAAEVLASHPIDDPMGPRSPWARMVEIDARVIMIGVGLESCSLLHHAERTAEVPYLEASSYAMPVEIEGQRAWIEVESGNNCSDGFPALEPELDDAGALHELEIGAARTLVLSAQRTVEVARAFLARQPAGLLCHDHRCGFCTVARAACER